MQQTRTRESRFRISALATLLLLPSAAFAQSSSASFRMTSEALNTGGGQSTSTNFAVAHCLLAQ
jgi:hypothetical protein